MVPLGSDPDSTTSVHIEALSVEWYRWGLTRIVPSMPIPRETLYFACVPRPPRAEAERLGRKWGRLGGPISVRAWSFAKQALAAHDTADYAAAIGLFSDSLLLKGQLARAREELGKAEHQPLSLLRRDAVLALLQGDSNAPRLLKAVADRAIAEHNTLESAVAHVLIAHHEGGRRAPSTIRKHLTQLRTAGEIDALCRLALIAADTLIEAGEQELALGEALRSLAHGREVRDRDLIRNAQLIVKSLMGSHSDKGVDDLVRVALDLGHETSLDAVLQRIAQSTLELTGADRAFVLLNGESGLDVVASAFKPGHSGKPSITIAETTLQQGREVVTPDVGGLEGAGAADSIQAMKLRMVLCIPMSDRVRVLGAIYADSQRAETQELEAVAWLVRAFAAHAVVALRNAELLGEARTHAQRAREVVHDVRNLANGMRLGLEELEELDALPDWARETLTAVTSMNDLLLGTVGALLAQQAPDRQPVQLDDLLRRTADLMGFEARSQEIKFHLEAEPATVHGSEQELARIAANLLGNALKYSPTGGTVRVSLRNEADQVRFSVADEGPGIPAESLDHIFDSGTQAEGAKHGYGLGLGICKHLVEGHNGTITASNAESGGAIFTITLPRITK